MTREEIEAIAREVYTKDPFPNTDEVWCNLHWLSKFAVAVEVHANSELIKDYAEWMSPEDYVPLTQERDKALAEVARLSEIITKTNTHIAYRLDIERQTATEAALRWGWGNHPQLELPVAADMEDFVADGLAALLGEGK